MQANLYALADTCVEMALFTMCNLAKIQLGTVLLIQNLVCSLKVSRNKWINVVPILSMLTIEEEDPSLGLYASRSRSQNVSDIDDDPNRAGFDGHCSQMLSKHNSQQRKVKRVKRLKES